MRGAVYVNGKIAPADEAVVPVYDHGFVYGEGIYETLRTYNRVPFLYDRHVLRLRQSAERILLDVPFDDATLLGVDRPDDRRRRRSAGGVHSRAADARHRRLELRPEVHAEAHDRDHREAVRRAAAARLQRRHPHLARRDAPQSPEVGEPADQVEQPAEQRAGDADGVSQRRRRSPDVQLSRRADRMLAGELLHGARRRRAHAEIGSRPARGRDSRVHLRDRARAGHRRPRRDALSRRTSRRRTKCSSRPRPAS